MLLKGLPLTFTLKILLLFLLRYRKIEKYWDRDNSERFQLTISRPREIMNAAFIVYLVYKE